MPLSLLQMEMGRESARRALTAEVIFGGQAVRSIEVTKLPNVTVWESHKRAI